MNKEKGTNQRHWGVPFSLFIENIIMEANQELTKIAYMISLTSRKTTEFINIPKGNDKMKSQIKEQTNNITEGVIWKPLLLFFFPILVGIFFQQLYNTVDTLIVGRFVGKEALSSVGGSAAQIINLIVGFFTGISTGAAVLISQYYGAKDEKRLQDTLHTAYAFSVIGGVIFGAVGMLCSPQLLRLMDTPEELMADSVTYVRIYFAGLIFVFVYNMGAAALRAIGDSKRPLYLLIVCCVINIVLDLVFVLILEMGVAGVGIATLLSQGISAILVTWLLMYRTNELKFDIRRMRLHGELLKKLLFIGLPTGIETSMYSISNIIIQTALNGFGVDTMAAWAAYGKIDSFYWMINNAFGISIMTFVGQNFGAGKWDRIRKAVRLWLTIAIVTALSVSTLLLCNSQFLFRIFTADDEVVEIGVRMMSIITPAYFLFEFIEIFSGTLRAEGDVIIPSIMVLCGTCLFRIVWLTVVSVGKSMEMIMYCYPITWGICAVMFIIYYLWKQKRVLSKEGVER